MMFNVRGRMFHGSSGKRGFGLQRADPRGRKTQKMPRIYYQSGEESGYNHIVDSSTFMNDDNNCSEISSVMHGRHTRWDDNEVRV